MGRKAKGVAPYPSIRAAVEARMADVGWSVSELHRRAVGAGGKVTRQNLSLYLRGKDMTGAKLDAVMRALGLAVARTEGV